MAGGESNGNRTHEPNLREVTADLDGVRDVMDERDKRYEQRFRAQEAAVLSALASVERLAVTHDQAHQREHTANQTAIDKSFDTSQRAIDKSEQAQKDRNIQQNEIRGQLDDQNKAFVLNLSGLIPRKEFESAIERTAERFEDLKDEIAGLRESRSEAAGAAATSIRTWGVVIVIATALINAAIYLLSHK